MDKILWNINYIPYLSTRPDHRNHVSNSVLGPLFHDKSFLTKLTYAAQNKTHKQSRTVGIRAE